MNQYSGIPGLATLAVPVTPFDHAISGTFLNSNGLSRRDDKGADLQMMEVFTKKSTKRKGLFKEIRDVTITVHDYSSRNNYAPYNVNNANWDVAFSNLRPEFVR